MINIVAVDSGGPGGLRVEGRARGKAEKGAPLKTLSYSTNHDKTF